jgi:hypothetical protein
VEGDMCESFFLDVGFGLDVDGGRLADFNGLE